MSLTSGADNFALTRVAVRAWIRRATRDTLVAFAVVMLLVLAGGFGVAALFLWLLAHVSAPAAAALTALILAGAAIAVRSLYGRYRDAMRPVAPAPTAALSNDLTRMVREKPVEALLMAASAGFGTGMSARQ